VGLVALLLFAEELPPGRLVYQVKAGAFRGFDDRLVEVSGGVYLPPETLMAVATELSRMRAENAELKKSPGIATALVIALCGVVVGGVATAVVLRGVP
jgi:hypothetical protein